MIENTPVNAPVVRPRLVGLAGKARSGKNTMADYLTSEHGFVQVSFAGALKSAAKIIFGLSEDQVNGNSKEVVVPYWGMSPRTILQKFGTDAMRTTFGGDIWVKALLAQMKQMSAQRDTPARFVVTDVRFPNEAEAVKEWGGACWHLTRIGLSPALTAGAAQHPSETALDNYVGFTSRIGVESGYIGGLYDAAELALEGMQDIVQKRY